MGIDKIQHFPFPTSPDEKSIDKAIELLKFLGALESSAQSQYPSITKLGKTLQLFPIHPRYAKMLVLGKQGECLPFIIAIVASLSVQNHPFLQNASLPDSPTPEDEQTKKKTRPFPYIHPLSDLLTLLKAVGAYEFATFKNHQNPTEFCEKNQLHDRTMNEIHLLRLQLGELVNSYTSSTIERFSTEMEAEQREAYQEKIDNDLKANTIKNLLPPSDKQELILRQIICSGLCDRVATLARNQPIVLEGTFFSLSPSPPFLLSLLLLSSYKYFLPSSLFLLLIPSFPFSLLLSFPPSLTAILYSFTPFSLSFSLLLSLSLPSSFLPLPSSIPSLPSPLSFLLCTLGPPFPFPFLLVNHGGMFFFYLFVSLVL